MSKDVYVLAEQRDGNIQKVSDLIYIIAPCHVDVFAELNEAEADGDVDRAYSLFN